MRGHGRDATALKTSETVLASLRRLDERDDAIDALVSAIEDGRARLLAAVITGQATGREPAPQRLH